MGAIGGISFPAVVLNPNVASVLGASACSMGQYLDVDSSLDESPRASRHDFCIVRSGRRRCKRAGFYGVPLRSRHVCTKVGMVYLVLYPAFDERLEVSGVLCFRDMHCTMCLFSAYYALIEAILNPGSEGWQIFDSCAQPSLSWSAFIVYAHIELFSCPS